MMTVAQLEEQLALMRSKNTEIIFVDADALRYYTPKGLMFLGEGVAEGFPYIFEMTEIKAPAPKTSEP